MHHRNLSLLQPWAAGREVRNEQEGWALASLPPVPTASWRGDFQPPASPLATHSPFPRSSHREMPFLPHSSASGYIVLSEKDANPTLIYPA